MGKTTYRIIKRNMNHPVCARMGTFYVIGQRPDDDEELSGMYTSPTLEGLAESSRQSHLFLHRDKPYQIETIAGPRMFISESRRYILDSPVTTEELTKFWEHINAKE
ncbi:hypothetical protein KW805_00595 [Candidatus Pacearchaeota archaeon]|nr:hypothetical protein [Candidatus Pacearchaeota archaeon]